MSDVADHEVSAEINRLKKIANRHYTAWERLVDSKDASCGNNLLAAINPDVHREAKEFNKILDQLSVIDPDCPTLRLPEGR